MLQRASQYCTVGWGGIIVEMLHTTGWDAELIVESRRSYRVKYNEYGKFKDESIMSEGRPSRGEKQDLNPSAERYGENNWIIGITLFVAGVILLAQNLMNWRIEKWWSIFLIIPSLGSFATAWRRYRQYGHSLRRVVLRPLVIGLLMLLVVPVLLFNLEWQMILAILLFMAGFVVLIGVFI